MKVFAVAQLGSQAAKSSESSRKVAAIASGKKGEKSITDPYVLLLLRVHIKRWHVTMATNSFCFVVEVLIQPYP